MHNSVKKSKFAICIFLMNCLIFFARVSFAQNAALVIIDMQAYFAEHKNFLKNPENVRKLEELLRRQTELITLSKQKNIPILLVEYKGQGTTDERLLKAIGNYPNVRTFEKKTDGMFEMRSGIERSVEKFLGDSNVSELLIAGANGGACVRCSIEGAINRGYNVWTDESAIADFRTENFVYPYSYEQGTITPDQSAKKELNHKKKIESLDEILHVAKNRQAHTEALQKCMKDALIKAMVK